MNAVAKRQKINNYLDTMGDKEITAVLKIVETIKTMSERQDHNWWEDEDYIAELDRRVAEYENGTAKGVTWDEVKAKVREAYKAKTKSK